LEESGDLGQVVVEDPVSAPGSGAVESVDAGAVESEVAFGAADPSFASGAPSDHLPERSSVLELATLRVRFAFARQHDMTHADRV
jgi:hypothetical protein